MNKQCILKKIVLSVLSLVMILSTFFGSLPATAFANEIFIFNEDSAIVDETGVNELVFSNPHGLPTTAQGGNILHAWNMSFNEIVNQLPYIAAAGFNTIQTSPIGDSIFQFPYYDGGRPTSPEIRSRVGAWWKLYQPRSFEIGNMLGTEAEFRALTAAAAEYGIGIIVDAVPNHTTSWWHEIDESLRRPELFHAVPGDGSRWDRNISNWGDREESRRARLLGLVTFDTTNHEFQEMYMEFLGRKIDAGATGFRYDAMVHIELPAPHDAPHIASDFWPNIQSFVDDRITAAGNTPFQYGEILHRWHADYLRALPGMSVTACGYGYHVRNNIIQGRLGNWDADNFHVSGYSGATAERFVTWVESHDTYGNAGGSRGITDSQMRVGWSIMTARKGTTPLFLVRPGAGFMNDGQMFFPNGDGSYRNAWGHSDFYRDTTITEVNWFANRFINEPERTSTHYNQVALIERGPVGAKEGVVIVNSGNISRAVDFPVTMVDGEYIDQVTGQVFTVENGRITGPAIFGQSVAVIHGTTARDTTPSVVATPGTSNFLDPEGVVVTLSASHTTSQSYRITLDGTEIVPMTSFVHGDEIIVGSGAQPGDEFVLELTGTNGEDVVTEIFVYTKGNPFAGIRIEFAHDAWDQVHIWGWHEGGGNIFAMGWNDAPLMVWEDDVDAWVYTINPFNHPQFNIDQPFNVMFHNGAGAQMPSGSPYWLIRTHTRIEIVNGQPVFIDLSEEPQVFATPGSTTFFDDEGITVTLSARNTTIHTFMLTDASGLITINATPFVDGQTITIGEGAFDGDEFTLILEGTNGSQTVRETFVYRREIAQPLRIEFAYGANWPEARIWAFRPGGGNIFPGANWATAPLMTWDATVDAWVFEFEVGLTPGFNVIFHNGAGTQRGVDCFVDRSVRITMEGTNRCIFGDLAIPVEPVVPVELDSPTNLEIVDGIISWNAVDNATGYRIYLDDAPEIELVETSFDLFDFDLVADNYLVRVRALGDGIYFTDSLLSAEVLFEIEYECDEDCGEEELDVLETPGELVLVDGILSWDAVARAVAYRVYINPEIEVKTTSIDLFALDLEAGTYLVQVRALGDGVYFADSLLSAEIEFTVYAEEDDEEYSDETFYDVEPELIMPEFTPVIPEDDGDDDEYSDDTFYDVEPELITPEVDPLPTEPEDDGSGEEVVEPEDDDDDEDDEEEVRLPQTFAVPINAMLAGGLAAGFGVVLKVLKDRL